MCFGGGGTQSQPSNIVTTTEEIPGYIEDSIKKAQKAGRRAFDKSKVPSYTSTFTGFDPLTKAAHQRTVDIASAGNPMVNAAQGTLTGILGGQLNPQQQGASEQMQRTASGEYLHGNPYFDELLQEQMGRQSALLKGAFSGKGRYGSSSMVQSMGDALTQLQTQALADNYGRERQLQEGAAQGLGQLGGQISGAQLQATGLLPTVDQARYHDAQMTDLIGQARSAKEKERLEDIRTKKAYDYDKQWLNAERLQALAQGSPMAGGMTQSSYGPKQDPLSSALGGILGIGGLVGGLF